MNNLLKIYLEVWPLSVMFLIWCSAMAYIMLQTKTNYYLKFILIPIMFIAGWITPTSVIPILGYAVPKELPKRFEYLGHNVIIENNKKKEIEVWLGGEKTRLIVIPYTKDMEKKMQEGAEKKQQKGARVTMERKDAKETGKQKSEGVSESEFSIQQELPGDIEPKT